MKYKTNMATLRFISKVAGKDKIYIVYLILIQAILGGSGVAYAFFMREMIDAATGGNRSSFIRYALFFGGLVLLQIALRAMTRFLVDFTKVTMENRLKYRLFSGILSKNYESVTGVHSGEWLNRLTSDATIVADGLVQILPGLSGMAVRLFSAVVFLIVIEPRFAYILIPGGLVLMIFSTAFRKVLKQMHKNIQESDGKVRIMFQEYLESLLVVRAYGVEDMAAAETKKGMRAYKKSLMRRNHVSNFCNVGFGIIMNGAYVAGAIFCSYGILTKTMTYGTFTAVLQLIGQVQSPFANITGYLPRYYAMLASAERLEDIEKLPDREEIRVYPTEAVHAAYENALTGFGLRDAGFTYQSPTLQSVGEEVRIGHRTVVLKHIDMDIKKGEYVAFTGPSGCGKSTALKLFLGLYPLDEGERYLCMGEKEEPLHSAWQKLFAFVPQGNHLMSGSIREVVAFSDKDMMQDEGRLWHALKVACAETFVRQLPDGLDTILGERGSGLSEGQMQRLAIARAIFSGHPILIMDEATSALDEKTERQLLCNLRSMTDRTVLLVTHRPAALEICDKVVQFENNGVHILKK